LTQEIALDDTDRRILMLLQEDADRPLQALADAAGLSLSPCWRRVKRLREAGVIRGVVAVLDPSAVGLRLTAFATVSLTNHSDDTVAAFDRALETWPEVTEVHKVTGDRDYLLRILVPDIEAYEDFLSRKLLRHPGVTGVNTRFSLKRVKAVTAVPL
jgi:DNA-binding Lrp family transcriptional regulator